MIEQSAVLTLEVTVSWREEMLVVAVVEMKLVPLLSREMASGGSDSLGSKVTTDCYSHNIFLCIQQQ